MATRWGAQKCLSFNQSCQLLSSHHKFAFLVAAMVLIFVISSLCVGGWTRSQWPLLMGVFLLVSAQISLGVLTMQLGLKQPFLTVSHQVVAALLIALLSALSCLRPQRKEVINPESSIDTFLEACHG